MALSNIALSAGMRNNLLGMQSTSSLMNTTSTRLGTGKKVNSALDNASSFFAAQSHMQRANDLAARKDGMSEAIQTIKAADAGIKGITTLVEQMKGLVNDSVGATDDVIAANQAAISEIATQITSLISDSSYKGTNLLTTGSDLNVYFNEDGSNSMTVTSANMSLLGQSADGSTFTTKLTDIDLVGDPDADPAVDPTSIDDALTSIQNALSALRSTSTSLSANLGVITARQEFTSNMMNTLQIGADNLTLADLNEEGANMLALQTQQQLSTSALSLASQANQAVLRLF